MTYSDALITYLALGSPFAVHFAMTDSYRSLSKFGLRVVVNLLWWPMQAASRSYIVLRKRQSRIPRRPVRNEAVIPLIFKQMENAANVPGNGIPAFQVRGTCERYAGLATVFLTMHDSESAEIFHISGHPAPALAAACMSRTTTARLQKHMDQARAEFIDLAVELARASDSAEVIKVLALRVADELEDQKGRSDLEYSFRYFSPDGRTAGLPVPVLD